MSLYTKHNLTFKSNILILGVLLTTCLIVFTAVNNNTGLKLGKSMPLAERIMKGVDGNDYTLNSLINDNGLIVVFSCNTCPFVIGSDKFEGWEKQYNELDHLAKSNKIGFVLVNSNEAKRDGVDSMEAMKEQTKASNYKMPYVVDNESALADACGAKTTPHVFVFDGDKELIYKGSIDNSWDSNREQLDKYLHSVIDHLANDAKMIEKSTSPRGCSIKRVKQ